MSRTTALLVILTTGVVSYLIRWKRQLRDLPPGPRRLPLIGSVLSLPPKLDSGFFERMSRQYNWRYIDSDIIHFDAAGLNMVVLNSYEAAQELLDKRSGIYSSRPSMVMISDVMGFGFEFGIWPYNDRWRAARRLFVQHFNKPEIYQPPELKYSRRLLQQLLVNPTKWFSHIQLLTASTTLDMTYGIRINSADDPLVKVVDEGMRIGCEVATKGAFLVDLIPALQYIPAWFPGAEFQRIGARARPITAQVVHRPFQASVDMMKTGYYKPSYMTSALEDIENNNGTEEDIALARDVAAQVFLAGSDTSKAVLTNFMAAMVTHPEIQRRAQKEIDSVLQGRLPDHRDLENLPYLTAVILETYRIQPILPIGENIDYLKEHWTLNRPGLPRASTMEDVYMGYRIPSGSLILANNGAFLHDEKHYPEPQKFNPDRFLKSGKLDPDVRNPMDIAFGFGRRICPGRHIAQSIIMLTTASILSTFDIVKQINANGQTIEPVITHYEEMVRQPREFPCDFKPRSQKAVDLLLSQSDEV